MSSGIEPRVCPYVGLDPFEPSYEEYFFGRGQDSKIIADHVRARAVTVLFGQSGVGKSSILNVGLPRVINKNSQWIIVTLRNWQDPEQLESLAVGALLKVLPHEPNTGISRHGFAPLVKWVTKTKKCSVLLILDQFEEYFLYRDAARMRQFEMMMGQLIARRDLPFNVLIALRDDALFLLNELRSFIPGLLDTTIRLDHLSDAGVREAISEPVAVYNKNFRTNGNHIEVKDEFVVELIRQLQEAGAGQHQSGFSNVPAGRIELPYLQLALTKLWKHSGGVETKALEKSTLSAVGGVNQIVRQHVNDVMNGLTFNEQALCARIFDRLVTGIGSKIAYPTAALRKDSIDDSGEGGRALEAILQKLTPADARIVKPVVAGGVPAYEIFHDVLCKAVLDWTRSFQAEANRKKELAAITNRVSVQEYRLKINRILLASALITVIVLATSLGGLYYQYRENGKRSVQIEQALGRSKWVSLELIGDELRPVEVEALWQLASASSQQQIGFLDPLVSRPIDSAIAQKFARRPQPILRALGLTGLSAEQASIIMNSLTDINSGNPVIEDSDALNNAIGALNTKLNLEQMEALADWLVTGISNTANISGSSASAYVVRALAEQLSPMKVKVLSRRVKKELAKKNGPNVFQLMLQAVLPLANTFSPDEIQQLVDQALMEMMKTKDVVMRDVLTQVIAELSIQLFPKQANAVFDRVLKEFENESSVDVRTNLAKAIRELADELDPLLANAVAGQMLKLIANENEFAAVSPLIEALGRMKVKLSLEQVQVLVDYIVKEMANANSYFHLDDIARASEALADVSSPEQSRVLVTQILNINQVATTSFSLRSVSSAIQALAKKLSPEQVSSSINQVVTLMISKGSVSTNSSLVPAVRVLADRLNSEQAELLVIQMMKYVARVSSPSPARGIPEVIQVLAEKVGQDRSQVLVHSVLKEMGSTTDISKRGVLGLTVKALANKLSSEQAQSFAFQVLNELSGMTNTSIRRAPAQVLSALVDQLSSGQLQPLFHQMLDLMGNTNDLTARSALAETIRLCAEDLSPEQASNLIDQVLNEMYKSESAIFLILTQVVLAMDVKLSQDQGKALVETRLKATENRHDARELLSLAVAIRDLGVKLNQEQIKILVDDVLKELKNTDFSVLNALAKALTALADQLNSEQAWSLFEPMIKNIVIAKDFRSLNEIPKAARALGDRLSPKRAQDAQNTIKANLALAPSEEKSLVLVEAFVTLTRSMANDDYLSMVTEILKYPTTMADASNKLFESLSNRFPKAEQLKGSFDEAVSWLKDQPGVDVLRRPVRPIAY